MDPPAAREAPSRAVNPREQMYLDAIKAGREEVTVDDAKHRNRSRPRLTEEIEEERLMLLREAQLRNAQISG